MVSFIEEMRDKTIRARFQRNLSRIRLLIGWTAEDLGKKLEVSKQTIWNWEKNRDEKKLIPFSQAIALNCLINEKILEIKNTDYARYFYIKFIHTILMEEDNLELEEKIDNFVGINHQYKVTFEETVSLFGNEFKNIIEKKKKENKKRILFWMSKLIVDYELRELSIKSNKLLDELEESLSDLSVFEKIDILKYKQSKLKEEFFVYKKYHLGDINVGLSSSIEATMWAYTVILNIISIPISQEQMEIIREKLLRPTVKDVLVQNSQSSEIFKNTRVYFHAPNMRFVFISILKKMLIENKEKCNFDKDTNALFENLDRANDLISKYLGEWNEKGKITKENFQEIFYNNAVNVYGDIEKKFEEIYGEETKSKFLSSVDERSIKDVYKEIFGEETKSESLNSVDESELHEEIISLSVESGKIK